MLYVKVNSRAGEELIDVFCDMKEFADKLGVVAKQEVNGHIVLVFPHHHTPEQILRNYEIAAAKKYKVVS